MGCEIPTQKETGGKFLHLKICIDKVMATTATSNDLTLTNHNAKINDLVKFDSVAANTVINTTDYYYVVAIVDANKVEISNTKGGTAIVFDATGVPTGSLYTGLGGIRSKEFALASEAIDITNQDSDEWKEVLDEAGQKSATVSGSGVYNSSAAFLEMETKFLANKIVHLLFVDLKNARGYLGFFKLTQLSASGEYNGEGQFSISAESSGPVTVIDPV